MMKAAHMAEIDTGPGLEAQFSWDYSHAKTVPSLVTTHREDTSTKMQQPAYEPHQRLAGNEFSSLHCQFSVTIARSTLFCTHSLTTACLQYLKLYDPFYSRIPSKLEPRHIRGNTLPIRRQFLCLPQGIQRWKSQLRVCQK